MNNLENILGVASGNRSLSIAIEPISVGLIALAVFAGMLLALLTVRLLAS